MTMEDFETRLNKDLQTYLTGVGLIDKHLPECPDVEGKWKEIGEAYLPDGIREFSGHPTVSLGWMMFLGMAITKYWDEDWDKYNSAENLYEQIRNARGYDNMDEYILEEILKLDTDTRTKISKTVAECASRTESILRHEPIEPGSEEAFRAYIYSLRQMYAMGMAMELKRLGYHMTELAN